MRWVRESSGNYALVDGDYNSPALAFVRGSGGGKGWRYKVGVDGQWSEVYGSLNGTKMQALSAVNNQATIRASSAKMGED